MRAAESVQRAAAGPARAPRALYLAFYFPPTRASGVYRSRAVANYFVATGWDVTVITAQRELFRDYLRSYDPTLESTVRAEVTVERVPLPTWRWEPDIRRYSPVRAHFPQVVERIRRWWDERAFPEPYAPWIAPVVARGRALHRSSPYDVIVATGNPHSAFAAAYLLAKATGVPYVIDYRDSWTLNLFVDQPAYPPGHRAWRWERRILHDAAEVAFVNEALRDWHAHRYPEVADRMVVLQNGWEPDLLQGLDAGLPDPARPLRLGYLGTMTRVVPLAEFFAGWRLARREDVLADASVHLYGHLGYFASTAAHVRRALPLDEDSNVRYEGPVPKARASAVYNDVDVLLLLIAGSKYVTSGKVYEYMASGKPIVSVHDPKAAASEPLRGYPLWFPVADLAPQSIRSALLAAAAAARALTAEDVARARSYAARFTREAQLEAYERGIRDLVVRNGQPRKPGEPSGH